jgi:hypothetical protein
MPSTLRWLKAWNFDAVADQLGGDVGLQVGKCEHQIRLQIQNLVDLRRGECDHLGFLPPCLGRADGIAADADDAVLLAEQVERLDGLLGETDDALRNGHSVAARLRLMKQGTGHPRAR